MHQAFLTLLTRHSGRRFRMSSFQLSRCIFEKYMKMSVLIEAPPPRSHRHCVLLIADDISLGGSLISAPDRKAVLWRGCPSPTPQQKAAVVNIIGLLSFFAERIMESPILFSFCVYVWELFKSWSDRHFDAFCVQRRTCRRALCVSLPKKMSLPQKVSITHLTLLCICILCILWYILSQQLTYAFLL